MNPRLRAILQFGSLLVVALVLILVFPRAAAFAELAARELRYLWWLILLVAAMGLGVLLSVSALLLEEMSFHVYPAQRDVLKLLLAAVLENFGFRQLNSLWKLIGLYRWVRGKKATWGTMTRTASWQTR